MLCCANALGGGSRVRLRAVKAQGGRSERRKGGGDGVRQGGAGLCGALWWYWWWWWWWQRSGMRLRFKLRRVERWWLPRCASPGLVLPCSARICVVRQGWLLHTMQAGRGTVAYGTRLGMYTDSTGLAGGRRQMAQSGSPQFFSQRSKYGIRQQLPGRQVDSRCRNVGSRSTGGASPHFARGRSEEGPRVESRTG